MRTIGDIFTAIRDLLSEHGSVDIENEANDPKKAMSPFTELEYQLLRLSMLTEIPFRANALIETNHKKKENEIAAIGVQNLKSGAQNKKKENANKTAWASGHQIPYFAIFFFTHFMFNTFFLKYKLFLFFFYKNRNGLWPLWRSS